MIADQARPHKGTAAHGRMREAGLADVSGREWRLSARSKRRKDRCHPGSPARSYTPDSTSSGGFSLYRHSTAGRVIPRASRSSKAIHPPRSPPISNALSSSGEECRKRCPMVEPLNQADLPHQDFCPVSSFSFGNPAPPIGSVTATIASETIWRRRTARRPAVPPKSSNQPTASLSLPALSPIEGHVDNGGA